MPRTVPSQVVALIDRTYPNLSSASLTFSHTTIGTITAIARLVDEVPAELLTMDAEKYSNLICGQEAIRNAAEFFVQLRTGQTAQPGVNGRNALALIREALAECPDQMPEPSTVELLFVTDKFLRDSIRLDIGTAASAFRNGEWKAATVLAGSAAEALLLWAVLADPNVAELKKKPKGDPETWKMSDYIALAASLKLIKEDTRSQAALAQNFRNLIHPGRALRLGEVCDRATALTAMAAVEHIARDLNRA